MVRSLVFWMCVSIAVTGHAATVVPVSDAHVVDEADAIVVGVVVSEETVMGCEPLSICTRYRVVVERGLKGGVERDALISVRIPGGQINKDGVLSAMRVSAAPIMKRGDRVLLMLEQGDRDYTLRHYGLDAFLAVPSAEGELAVSMLGEAEMLGAHPFAANRARRFDAFVDAIARNELGDRSYWVRAHVPPHLTERNFQQCPDLPLVVSHEWRLSGTVDGFSVDDFVTLTIDALNAWNDEVPSLAVPFVGSTTATWNNLNDDISVITQDPQSFLPTFSPTTGGIVAAATRVSTCRPSQGFREIHDGFVIIANGAGPWLSSGVQGLTNVGGLTMTHEFGHTLGAGHSCGDSVTPACSTSSYLNAATMRAFLQTDGRGTALGQWDRDFLDSRFANNTGATSCQPSSTVLCLNGGRFQAEVSWRDFTNNTGDATARDLADVDDSGLFWFFDPNNIEMLIKVLDGCAINGHYWVFAAATTNVEYTIRVTDTSIGTVRTYTNTLGNASPAFTENMAFATCP
ncbi:MAG: hypothetical protein AAGD38_00220 [Acidobacteriota bacterium]